MGKVSKRQRKFLSKNVLPHRKKGGGRRLENKGKGDAGNNNTRGAEQAAPPSAAAQERKTLPDGVDIAAFLDCPWLSRQACAAAGRDTCVALFEPEESLLEAQAKANSAAGRTGKGSSARLSEKAAQAMIGRAVDDASSDDLLCAVWALKMTQTARLNTSPGESASGPHAALRADPGSKASDVLRREGFGRLHLAFLAQLGPEREEEDSTEAEWEEAVRAHRQHLERAEPWPRVGGALLSFLTTALDDLETCPTASVSAGKARRHSSKNSSSSNGEDSQEALLEGLARMRSHVALLFPFPRLARRQLAFLLSVLETADDRRVPSLAFARLYELATSQPMPFLHDAFKGAYRCYRAAAVRLGGGKGVGTGVLRRGGKGDGALSLLRECFAELFGVEKPSAYLVSERSLLRGWCGAWIEEPAGDFPGYF